MIRPLALATLIAAPLHAQPVLTPPIACTLWEDCFILQYVDSDPGPEFSDFTCQSLSYDGHKGTDFALPSFAAMETGVDVLAPAAGTIKGMRNGMPDTGYTAQTRAAVDGKECGNGVVIDHGDGWETQLCHLAQGSVSVRTGDKVEAGAVLGRVGYSGKTQFPHVHISVRHNGAVIDPFNLDGARTCGTDDGPEDDLWAKPIHYRGSTLILAGFSDGIPAFDAIKAGTAGAATLPPHAPALVGWSMAHAVLPGDILQYQILTPARELLIEKSVTLEKRQAMVFRAVGKKRPEGGWQTGEYVMSARHLRDGALIGVLIERLIVE